LLARRDSGFILFDDKGEYLNYRSNSSCAAGTGSFLDQQAKRLNLSGIEEFAEIYLLLPPVEIDICESIESGKMYQVYLGMDIGSTSTKAILMDENKNILAGFYTRTSGRPVEAIQVIFESIDEFIKHKNITLKFLASGTTGSGRKFIKEITGADIALDEITGHARAAYELCNETDTIIEIGGQDSKFTTMRNGMVTFSIMNNVCPAGTGNFIEEQAKKLNCPLSGYSECAESARAPLSSDKCTVFMERDINFYLSDGYSVSEVLASVLHSVRENYLTKVAKIASIGKKIFFQGATAKNKALVAAFEQRLGKPIMASRYCHLTGAMGVALHLHDQNINVSKFRGINIY
jgi:predicted CoA-substrate-specific enzyme activase